MTYGAGTYGSGTYGAPTGGGSTATATITGRANLQPPNVKTTTQVGHARLRVPGVVSQIGGRLRVFIPGFFFPPAQIKFTRAPSVPSNDAAVLLITDLNGNPPAPGCYLLDGPLLFTANDSGAVIGLTVSESRLIANANGVGVVTVTVTGTEAGQVVTGTLVCTATLTFGQLHTAWTSGTITVF